MSIPFEWRSPVLSPHRPVEGFESSTAHDGRDVAVTAFFADFVASPPEVVGVIRPADS